MSEAVKSTPAPSSASGDVLAFISPPFNLEAEQALLGALFVNNDVYEHVSGWLKGDHFYEGLHGRIYDAACALIDKGRAATPISLKPYFSDDEPVSDGLEVWQYMGRLAAGATTVINAREYAGSVHESWKRRELMALAGEMSRRAAGAAVDDLVDDQIEDAESALYELGEEGGRLSSVMSFGAAARTAIENIDAARQRGDGLAGLSCGINVLDGLVGGLADSDLIILGGRPSMGKTTLAVNLATNIAAGGDGVAFFSLEMSSDQLASKIMSTRTGIGTDHMRRGDLDDDDFRHVIEVARRGADLPLYIDQQGGLTIAQLSMRARRMKRKIGIRAVFVDYIQLMGSKDQASNYRVQELTRITMGLKALAKELSCPVIALSQLSRNVETRANKRPMLSDLRDSGSIEQDADIVLFVYRDDYYLEREKPDVGDPDYAAWAARLSDARGKCEVIAAKHRHGAIGAVDLSFNAEKSLFHDNVINQDNGDLRV